MTVLTTHNFEHYLQSVRKFEGNAKIRGKKNMLYNDLFKN